MKILHLVGAGLDGGAARGAYWLHQALTSAGIQSRILVDGANTLGNPTITSTCNDGLSRLGRAIRMNLDQLPVRLYRKRDDELFSPGFIGAEIIDSDEYRAADLVNIHWINKGFVSLSTIGSMTKPIVWTLRDMWPMTGGCHYSFECLAYTGKCGRCPRLGSDMDLDLSRLAFSAKRRAVRDRNIEVVGISSWISSCARNSTMFRDSTIHTIPNAIDAREFQAIDKKVARKALGLPDKKIILFGAQDIGDIRKGHRELAMALGVLGGKEGVRLVTFGKSSGVMFHGLGIEVTSLGFLPDTHALRLAYSAADVFVAPSRAESFGKTSAEAMCCGTPAVAFDATGQRDIIDHQINGFLATPFEPAGLAKGIEWVLGHPNPDRLRESAARKIEDEFSPALVAARYIGLYAEVLGRRGGLPSGSAGGGE